jgi:hypothetical protein
VDPRISKVFTDGHFLCIKGNNKTTTNQIQRTLLRLKPTFDEGKKANVFIESLYEGKLLACKPKWDEKGYWFRCQVNIHILPKFYSTATSNCFNFAS